MKTPLHPEPLSLVIPAPASWQTYLSALQRAEKYWVSSGRLISRGRVFDTRHAISWQKTISLGHALIQKGNWHNLSQRDIAILFGYNHGATDYGLLADTGRAAIAREAFITIITVYGKCSKTILELYSILLERKLSKLQQIGLQS